MPDGWKIHQVFDFLFKAHKVLDIKFETVLENAMEFVQNYFYQLNDGQKKPSQQMKELFHAVVTEMSEMSLGAANSP